MSYVVSPPSESSTPVVAVGPFLYGGGISIADGRPNVRGGARLAGDSPDGLVLSNTVPVARPIRVYHRGTGELIASLSSASDGTWQVPGLSAAIDFDVQIMGTATGEHDVFAPKVRAT